MQRREYGNSAGDGRSGVLRTEPIFVVSALRAPAAIASHAARRSTVRHTVMPERCREGGQAKPQGRKLHAATLTAGPSERFVKLTRDPDLPRPWRFEPTVKSEGDIVL